MTLAAVIGLVIDAIQKIVSVVISRFDARSAWPTQSMFRILPSWAINVTEPASRPASTNDRIVTATDCEPSAAQVLAVNSKPKIDAVTKDRRFMMITGMNENNSNTERHYASSR